MSTTRSILTALVTSALMLSGCNLKNKAKADDKSAKPDTSAAPASDGSAASSGDAKAAPSLPEGKFTFMMTEPKDPKYKKYKVYFEKGSRLEAVVGAMGVYALPKDIPIVARECGTPNAFYSPQKHAISVCYELADVFYTSFITQQMADKDASKMTLDGLTFTLLHEMGHALIAELDIGVSGGEEDNVDDLAGLILIQNKKPEWAVAGPVALMQLTKGQKPAYFDEHSISEQRLGNILCMIYGSNPQAHGKILENMPELRPRAPKCPKEYAQRDKFWTQALTPHTRTK